MTEFAVPEGQRAWERTCHSAITRDIIWRLDAYRAALYLFHCVRADLARVAASPSVQDQLLRAGGGVSAAISEGYSRRTRADRHRFYNYALGSIRECFTWYVGLDDLLEPSVLDERLETVSRNLALTTGLLRSDRG